MQGIILLAALPAGFAAFGFMFTGFAWLLKLIMVGRVQAGIHRYAVYIAIVAASGRILRDMRQIGM